MNSFKMKALALAVFGLGGLAVAGSAFAVCPTGIRVADGGAWSDISKDTKGSTLTIQPGGYDSSACKLQSSLANNGTATAQVIDNSPQAPGETHYRAQFIFDPTNLSGANGTNTATIFLANAASFHNGVQALVEIDFTGKGGGSTTSGKRIYINAACEGAAGGCGADVGFITLPVQTGPNRIEFDLKIGASGTGSLRYWVTDLATVTTDANPSGTAVITGGNAGWVGVKTAYLGLAAPTTAYRAVNGPAVFAWFDQFDSRRSTFIGHP